MTILSVLWFFLIALLIAGYFVLDGFDLGVGVLYPFIAKDEQEQAIARRSIGPVWDGNEVWLLTAGGALFAAFPDAYATTFSGFYLAVMLVLFGLIVRAVSFEFWAADKRWRKVWNACFFLGSLLPALLLGVAVGNIYAGIPMDAAGNYIGVPLFGLITPFTLLTGLLGLAMFLGAGACWLALKAPLGSDLQQRAARLRLPLQVAALALFVVVSAYAHLAIQLRPVRRSLRGLPAGGHRRRGQEGVLARAVPGPERRRLQPDGAPGLLHVPEPGGGLRRQHRPEHHPHERGGLGAVAHLHDHHPVHRPAARAGVPRGHLPHVPRARGRSGPGSLGGSEGEALRRPSVAEPLPGACALAATMGASF